MSGSCLSELALDQPAAILHVARALHPLAERAEVLVPQRWNRQQDQPPATVERMVGFRGRAGTTAAADQHHIGAEQVHHGPGLAHIYL